LHGMGAVGLFFLAIVPLGATGCGDDDGGGSVDAGGGGTDSGSGGTDGGGGSTDAGSGGGTDGGGSGTDAGGGSGTDAGNTGMCAAMGASCAGGQTCCADLMCCSGMPIPPGSETCGTTCPRSDRNVKEGFEDVVPEEILEGVTRLPISRWSYIADPPGVHHVGPMAQDFQQTFDVGATDRMIFPVDADGVALASIQALAQRTEALRAQNEALRQQLATLQSRLDALGTGTHPPRH